MDRHRSRNRPRTRQLVLGFAIVTLTAILMISRIVTDRCNRAGHVVSEGARKIVAKVASDLQDDLTHAQRKRAGLRAEQLAASVAYLQEHNSGDEMTGLMQRLAACGVDERARYLVVDTGSGIEADSELTGGRMPGPVRKAVLVASEKSVGRADGPTCMIAGTAGHTHYVAGAPIPGRRQSAACVVLSEPADTVAGSVPPRMQRMTQALTGFVHKELAGVNRGISGLSSVVVLAAVLLLCVAVWMVMRSEHILAESEQRYSELVENALMAVAIYRNGRLTFVNRRVTELLGYEADELIGQSVLSIVHPDDRQMVMDRVRRRENGENVPLRSQFRFLTSDGNVLWGDVRSRRMSEHPHRGVISNIIDVTEQHRAEQRLVESEQKFRTFTEKSLHPIWVIQDGRVVYCNSAFAFYVGLGEPAEAIGVSVQRFVGGRNIEDVKRALGRVKKGEAQYQRLLVRFKTVHETIRWHDIQFAQIEYESQPAILGSGQDVTELKLVMEELDQQRLRDGLTGLYNRRYFNETVCDDPEGLYGDGMTVLSVDVDRLKAVNDTFGHAAGDIVLQEVADVLTSHVEEPDTVMRVGGDEFIVVLPEADPDRALQVERKLEPTLRDRLGERANEGDLDSRVPGIVGLSGGVAHLAGEDDRTIEETLRQADRRMYARKDAKKAGRDDEDLQSRRRRAS